MKLDLQWKESSLRNGTGRLKCSSLDTTLAHPEGWKQVTKIDYPRLDCVPTPWKWIYIPAEQHRSLECLSSEALCSYHPPADLRLYPLVSAHPICGVLFRLHATAANATRVLSSVYSLPSDNCAITVYKLSNSVSQQTCQSIK